MRNSILSLVAGGATLIAGSASALPMIQFDLLESRFVNAVGGNVLTIDNTFGDPSQVCWGQAGLNPCTKSSGFTYTNSTTPFSENPNDVFALGEFTHYNLPINENASIKSVQLEITGTISAAEDGGPWAAIGQRTFIFDIMHNETLNGDNPCKSSVPDVTDPVNAAGCADEVTMSIASGSEYFTVGLTNFTLEILGVSMSLEDAGNGIFTPTFLSSENAVNSRIIAAQFTATPTTPVPLPAALPLMGAGLAVLGFAARRRRS